MMRGVCDLVARLLVAERLLERHARARTGPEREQIDRVLRDAYLFAKQAGVSDSAMQRASRRVGRKAGLSADDLKIYVPSSVRSGRSKTRTMGTATGSRRLPM